MCTVATWKDNGIAVVTGRNMDWKEKMHTKLWCLPAGQERQGSPHSQRQVTWTSRYGSIVASVYDIAVADGMNEKGLSAHLLWLTESDYGQPNPELPDLTITFWAQYFLDSFASVQEALDHLASHPFNVKTVQMPGDTLTATVHLILNDANGGTAVMEYTDGTLHIWSGKEYCVTTNSPTFDKQLENIGKYEGLGGSQPLPGDTEPASRFVRSSYYLQRLAKPDSDRMAIAGIISVLRNAAQPFGTPDPTRPHISATIWRTVSDHTNLRYYFESTTSPFLTWVDMKDFDFTPGALVRMFDIEAHEDHYGDIAADFAVSPPLTFAVSGE